MSTIAEKFGGLVEFISGQSTVTEANVEATLKEVKTILLDADVNLQVANALLSKVKEKAIGMKVESGRKPGEQFISLLAMELVEIMGKAQAPLTKRTDGRPSIILMSGLQGAGKTTAAAKLASWSIKQQYAKKPLLVAADVYRPAAIDQLKILGERLSVDVYSEGTGANPVQICRRALAKALAEGYDVIIVDTAVKYHIILRFDVDMTLILV
jgi:signal recognition particle subunit SRP54